MAGRWQWRIWRRWQGRRRRILLVLLAVPAVLAVLAAGGLLLLGSRAPAPARETAAPPAVALTLAAPDQIAAGEPLTVTVRASPPLSGTEVLLAAQGSSGLLAQSAILQDGAALFVLPGGWTQAAGVATLRAQTGGSAASRTVAIAPGAAANPLFTTTGPASAPIGGSESPMLVALPLDARGNPVAAGAPVVVRTQRPATGAGQPPAEMIRVLTHNLLAAARLATHTAAGVLTAAASSDAAHSPSQSVRITPAEVQHVTVEAAPARAPADGSTQVRLATAPLADAYGNLLPDGVAVFFVADSADGSRRWLPAVTVSGRAAVALAAPAAATVLTVTALVGEAASTPITLTFTAAQTVAPFDLAVTTKATATADEGVTLRAGPLLTALGALAADGTPVTFVLTDEFGRSSTRAAVTEYGFATTAIYAGNLPAGAYTVTAQAGGALAAATFIMPAPVQAEVTPGVTPEVGP